MNEPRTLLASWSTPWKVMPCMLQDIARDVAAQNCRKEVDCSANSVAESATIRQLAATSSSLFSNVSNTYERERELMFLLGKLSEETASTISWDEVKRFFGSACDDARGFNVPCAKEAAGKFNSGNLHMKNVSAAAQQLLASASCSTSY